MDYITSFMGHPPAYWHELQARLESSGGIKATEMFEEIVMLRGKLSFHESRIAEMARLLPK